MKPLVLLLLASRLSGADQAMFKVDAARTGYSKERLKPPASLVWKADFGGAFYSSPAIVSGTVYLGNSNHQFYAVSLADGSLRWKKDLGERIFGSSPSVLNGKAHINVVDGCSYALDLSNGDILLKQCFKGRNRDVLGSPLVEGNRLYFGSDNGEVQAFDMAKGVELWSYKTGDHVHDCAPTLLGSTLFVASFDGRVYALDKTSGALKWKSERYDTLNTTVAALGGKIYFGAKDEKMHCLDAATGKQIWAYATDGLIVSSPALDAKSDLIVFGSRDGAVYGLSMDNGRLKWRFQTKSDVHASPLITGKTVWIASFDGKFYALDAATGAELWRYDLGKKAFSSAAASGDKIVLGGLNGLLYCFQATPEKP